MSGTDVHGWHPMATAPRDGTRVLVWSATESTYHVLIFDKTPPPGWMSQEGDYVVFEDQEPLSHWMTLPAPPITNDNTAPLDAERRNPSALPSLLGQHSHSAAWESC